MNQPPGTENGLTGNVPNSTVMNVSIDSHTKLSSTAEKTDLLNFVENFPLNSPNFRRPSPRPPIRTNLPILPILDKSTNSTKSADTRGPANELLNPLCHCKD